MEEKIQEVEQYFRSKLISGDFTVKCTDRFAWAVLVDNKYTFSIWVANGESGCDISNTIDSCYMVVKLSDADKKELWSNLDPLLMNYKKDADMNEKKRQYELLKIELNIE